MWICKSCGTENEDNFKFCWSCGENRAKTEIPVEPPPTAKPKQVEKIPEPPKPVEKTPGVKEKPPVADVDELPVITRVNPKPKVQPQKFDDDEDVLPMLTRVAGVEKSENFSDEDISLERKVFTIAVRLVGLFLLYQIFVGLPDMFVFVSAALRENKDDISEMFTSSFVFPVARFLVYFFVGIYLIASGRILIWLLPRR